jgi:hypothetical protein
MWIDAGGALQVGPQSAGAAPGPVCYDKGGDVPTLTDANVLLGFINPKALVGGALKLNAEKARLAFAEMVAKPLRMTIERAAYGAFEIAASNMIRAIKAISVERGRDPRDFALFAFGGNGPLFAAEMASALGISRVVVPPSAGLFSSFGLLYADLEHHYRAHCAACCAAPTSPRSALPGTRRRAQAKAQLGAEGFVGPRTHQAVGGGITKAKATSWGCLSRTVRLTTAWSQRSRPHSRRSMSAPTAIAPAQTNRSSWYQSRWWASACASAACPNGSDPTGLSLRPRRRVPHGSAPRTDG